MSHLAARVLNARFVASYPRWKGPPGEELPEVCFAGRSNVGKSSLINALVNQKSLARTSSTPGRTREIVLFRAELRREADTVPFHLVDLPGYGYAKVPVAVKETWRPMVAGYFGGNARLRCCVFLLDIRRTPSEGELELLEMMGEHEVPLLPVVTKIDKVPRTQRQRELRRIAKALDLEDWRDLRPVCAMDRSGMDELAADLFDLLAGG